MDETNLPADESAGPETPVEEKPQRPSLDEAIDQAIETVEQNEQDEQKPDKREEAPRPHPEHEGRDEKGRFLSQKEDAPTEEPAAEDKAEEAPREAQAEAVPPPPAPAAPTAFKAPQSWRPAERTALEKADPVVQQAVARREREMAQAFQQHAPHKKFVDEWQQTVQPFEGMIRASGQTPLASVKNMLGIAQALATQPIPVRAQLIAGFMRVYGVSPQDLGTVLEQLAAGQPMQQPVQMQDPRLDQLWDREQQRRVDEASAAEQEKAAEDEALEAFVQTHEWVNDPKVAEFMADSMELAAKHGTTLEYEEAYQRALSFRPDLMEIERQRAAESAKAPTPDAANAAASIKSSPRSKVRRAGQRMSLDEAITAAIEKHAGDDRV